MKQFIVALGWLFILCLIALMVYAVLPTKAHAAAVPAYELVMATYASDKGHATTLRSYIDIFRAPYPDADACEDAREFVVEHREPYRDPKTLATHLAEVFCVKNPGVKPAS